MIMLTVPAQAALQQEPALHTGMAQEHHKRTGYEDNIPWEYPNTMAGELANAGYYCQCVGKMHVHPLRNYLGFHNVELHDGYLHSARYTNVPWQESRKMRTTISTG